MFEIKFPNANITDESVQMTCPFEIKYDLFTQKDGVIKSGNLISLEVYNNI